MGGFKHPTGLLGMANLLSLVVLVIDFILDFFREYRKCFDIEAIEEPNVQVTDELGYGADGSCFTGDRLLLAVSGAIPFACLFPDPSSGLRWSL